MKLSKAQTISLFVILAITLLVVYILKQETNTILFMEGK